jgi:hypothetical protein
VILIFLADATLELKSVQKDDSIIGILTVQLSKSDSNQAVAISVNTARRDIESNTTVISANAADSKHMQILDATEPEPSRFVAALANVIWKLDIFIRIVDKTSKVGWYHLIWDQNLTLT